MAMSLGYAVENNREAVVFVPKQMIMEDESPDNSEEPKDDDLEECEELNPDYESDETADKEYSTDEDDSLDNVNQDEEEKEDPDNSGAEDAEPEDPETPVAGVSGTLPILDIEVFDSTGEYDNEIIDRNLLHKKYFKGYFGLRFRMT